jgi:hypothetical protein
MDRGYLWDTLSYIGTPLGALMLGSMPFAWMRCSARTALIVSAATYIPQGILMLVWSERALSAFDTRHVSSFAEALPANVDELWKFLAFHQGAQPLRSFLARKPRSGRLISQCTILPSK